MTYALIASAVLGGILLVLLTVASGNTSIFAEHYPLLLALNIAVAAGLLGLVGFQLVTLARALRKRRFGSRLTLRFLLLFAVMALAPGALVYTVSVQFLAKSIESWLDVRVENALEGSLNLARVALDGMLDELNLKARSIASELAELTPTQQTAQLDRVRERTGAEHALIVGASGVIASASRAIGPLMPDAPPTVVLRQARQNRGYRAIEPSGERGLMLRVVVPLPGRSVIDEPKLLQLTQIVPAGMAASADAVQTVYRNYKELMLSREGLKDLYILTLTLTLLLALFFALALAFILSRRLSAPLATLAQATEAVARGDFSRRAAVTSTDELGTLSRSFNSMTVQLDEARTAAERGRRDVETAKTYLEQILANLSTGVLVFDRNFQLRIANAGANRILGQNLANLVAAPLESNPGLAAIAKTIRADFGATEDGVWQREIELPDRGRTLLVRGSRLPAESDGDLVVVFDDVTQIIAAQRATAWAEVAQRVAHEIKNPLTPIQLAAERLQLKLAERLGPEDAGALKRATDTIINQVAAMKRMVDEFREYARLPAPNLVPLDLNALVNDVLSLYEHARPMLRVRLAAVLPPVRGDASQLRQVIHNLFQNAEDALAGHAAPTIEVSTEIVDAQVRLCVADNGAGFPEAIMKRAFEPYVTTKPKGTGLGLAMVKKIVDEHQGSVDLENAKPGAIVTIALPIDRNAQAKAA